MALGIFSQPLQLRRLPDRLPHRARRPAIATLNERRRRQRFEPPRRAGHVSRFVEPIGGGAVVLPVPVVHEPDILHVLPLVGPFP